MDGTDAGLTQNEYKIVSLLGKYAGKVMTYDSIIKEIWGPNMKNDNRILRVNMANIRRKIEKNPAEPQYIFTEVGVGYRIVEAGLRGGQGIDGTEGIAHFLPAGQKLVKDGGVGGGGTVEKDNGSCGYGPGAF